MEEGNLTNSAIFYSRYLLFDTENLAVIQLFQSHHSIIPVFHHSQAFPDS